MISPAGQRLRPREDGAGVSLLTEYDFHLFNEGGHFRLYEKLGAHPLDGGGAPGAYFAVWAPNARSVSVIGDFNDWDPGAQPLRPCGQSGIWEGFARGATPGALYKYHIVSQHGGYMVDKADPLAVATEPPPGTASRLWDLAYRWGDDAWMAEQHRANGLAAPIAIYELHAGSWMRVPEEERRPLTYRELAVRLAPYLRRMGFTHVELLPVMEHPFFGSWGYQVASYFAPTSRYGTPQDLMFLIDHLHQHGIGVILDWVPSHFPTDEHGLIYFDGTHLYEHADPRRGFHPDWTSGIFNYGRREVQSFLISSALFWLDVYHADGLRVDAVASMLYADYSRQEGGWIPNQFGGRENLEAVAFLRRLNEEVYRHYPDVQTIAEDSTAWPMVSRPTSAGGLGFGMKWDLGWMHDTLYYMGRDPIHRRHHHDALTFRMLYAFRENFVLPLSHDEVVHGKGSLLSRLPGDEWQQCANLRLLLGYQYAQPGKKLLFMGGEFGQRREWHHEESLDWHLLEHTTHAGIQQWVRDLNRWYRREPAMHELDCEGQGFAWVDCADAAQSVVSFLRRARSPARVVLCVFNFTPVPREGYRLGVPRGGFWREALNSDARQYGGSGVASTPGAPGVAAAPHPFHGLPYSVRLTLPPLAAVMLVNEAVLPWAE
jgi:1,4-alpha-glucan branching enzyme